MIASKDLFKILFGLVQGDIVYEDLHNMTYLHDTTDLHNMTDLLANTSQSISFLIINVFLNYKIKFNFLYISMKQRFSNSEFNL